MRKSSNLWINMEEAETRFDVFDPKEDCKKTSAYMKLTTILINKMISLNVFNGLELKHASPYCFQMG